MSAKDVFKPKEFPEVEKFIKKFRIKEKSDQFLDLFFVIQARTLWGFGWWQDVWLDYDGSIYFSMGAENFITKKKAVEELKYKVHNKFFTKNTPFTKKTSNHQPKIHKIEITDILK